MLVTKMWMFNGHWVGQLRGSEAIRDVIASQYAWASDKTAGNAFNLLVSIPVCTKSDIVITSQRSERGKTAL